MSADSKRILNAPTEGVAASPPVSHPASDLASRLQRTMLRLKGTHMSEDGRGVDYAALGQSDLFSQYVQLSRELCICELGGLSEEEKKAFFINIYNALTIHGLALEPPRSVLDMTRFWQETCYCIGGHNLSLDDIEHGILRGNRPHPSSSSPTHFPEGDCRSALALPSCDPRIHFALNCGAKSCPAIQVYSAHNLDSALSKAAQNFCSQEVSVERESRKVRMSKIFNWYSRDFGSSNTEILRWVSQYLPEDQQSELEVLLGNRETVDIEHTDYNWLLNKL